jgi:hypothetical protein
MLVMVIFSQLDQGREIHIDREFIDLSGWSLYAD